MQGHVKLLRGYQSGRIVIAWELIPLGGEGGGLGAALQQFCLVWSLALLSSSWYLWGQYTCPGATTSSARLA